MTRPTPVSNRLEGLDLARYIAFVGMVVVNFKIAKGVSVGRKRVERLMKAKGLRGVSRRKFVVTTQREGLEHGFGIAHSTIQIEREPCDASCLRTIS